MLFGILYSSYNQWIKHLIDLIKLF